MPEAFSFFTFRQRAPSVNLFSRMKYRPALIDPVKIYALREILYGVPNRERGGRCAENPWSLLLCKSDMLPLWAMSLRQACTKSKPATTKNLFAVAGFFTHVKSGCSLDICNCIICGKSAQGSEPLFYFLSKGIVSLNKIVFHISCIFECSTLLNW